MESANPPAEPVNPEGQQVKAEKDVDIEPSVKNDANDFAFSSDDEKEGSKRARGRSPSEEQKRSERDRRSQKSQERVDTRDRRRDNRPRGKPRFPSFKGPQMTLREFENYQDGRFQRYELRDAYNDYVTAYGREFQYQFYRKHRNDPWFIERYDPAEIYRQKDVLKKYC